MDIMNLPEQSFLVQDLTPSAPQTHVLHSSTNIVKGLQGDACAEKQILYLLSIYYLDIP